MSDQPTAELEAENQVETVTPEIESNQTDEVQVENVDKQEGIDYKAELGILQGKVAKAEEIIGHKNRAIETLKKKSKDPEFDSEDFESRMDQMLESKLAKFKMASQVSLINNEVTRVATNSDEAELIRFHLEKSIQPSGDPQLDVRRAKALANEKKLKLTNKELGESLKSKNAASGANFSGQRKQSKPKPEVSPKDLAFLKKWGVKEYEGIKI